MSEPRKKANYVGAPAIFALEQAMAEVNRAFNCHASYLVGSSNERADWRDVDVRMIMDDEAFAALFPNAGQNWEFDPRWLLLTVSVSKWISDRCGLPIDFQFQPRTHANERHAGERHAVGIRFAAAPTTGETT